MNTQDVMVLEWTYSPPDYFEEPDTFSRSDYQVTIQDGKIEARMAPNVFEGNPQIKDVIEDALNSRFRGVQLFSHRGYELSYAGRLRVHPDGHRDLFVTPSVATLSVRTEIADITVTDEGGTIKHDSRKERVEKKQLLADLAEKHVSHDPLARSILASYHAAATNPDNELVHLYEIREALAKRFGGDEEARTALQVNKTAWSKLGSIANDKPIKQGRHRGKFVGALNDATESELKQAREIAVALILGYFQYLDRRS